MTDWKADPKHGAALVEPRRQEVVAKLKEAADVAYFHIDEQLEQDIKQLRKKAGEQKAKITKQVIEAQEKPAMQIVRKYWHEDADAMWMHFVHNMTKD